MGCFEVDGGSSSSHGHTDTETPVLSPGHKVLPVPGARLVSECSGTTFDPSLLWIQILKYEEKKRGKSSQ